MGVQLDLLSWRPQPVDQGPKRRAVRRPKAKKPLLEVLLSVRAENEAAAEKVDVDAMLAHIGAALPFCAAAHAWFHRPKIGA